MDIVPTSKSRRSPLRAILPLTAIVACLAAGCPVTRNTVEDVPPEARTARIPLGETTTLYDGALRVTFADMDRAGSFADVTLIVTADGRTATERVTVTRQKEHSGPVRLAPWTVAVVGFPGVDSVEVVAWRSGASE